MGIPILIILGFVKRLLKSKKNKSINKIGIYKEVGIGDLILATAAIKALRSFYPNAEIVLFCNPSNFVVSGFIPWVSKVVVVQPSNPVGIIGAFRKEKLDVLFDMGAWPRINAICSVLSGAKRVVGFKTPGQYRHYAYDLKVPHSTNIHEYENYLSLVSCFVERLNDFKPSLEVKINTNIPERITSKKYIVFHIKSGGFVGHFREWPIDYWKSLAKYFVSLGLSIILTGSEQDKYHNELVIEKIDGVINQNIINAAGVFSFEELASVLYYSQVVITVDTGILHYAAVIGAKVISLHGPSNPKRWGGVGPNVYPLVPSKEGCCFLNYGFEFKNRATDCMNYITVENVVSEFNKINVSG
ncbi:MAG: glycosyltransferase family 9 protein [Deltaproteobacteria bacterium]|nr:glycosyltransferase family 9 protein [Deltaproteobacteria bacterium]